jgi:hypothetical protein
MESSNIKSNKMLTPPTLTSVGNYAEVFEDWNEDYGELYGNVASILNTGKEYLPKPIVRSDFEPEPEPEVEGEEPLPELTQSQKQRLREACILRRETQMEKNKINLEKMFKGIWKRCSLESKEKIKERGGTDFHAAELSNDTVSLIKWIKESHHTAVMGRGPQMATINREDALSILNALHQQDESITAFAKKYQNAVNASIAAGNLPVDEPTLAIRFLAKLNLSYAAMNREMTMKAMMGEENSHPKTLGDAIYVAANWIPLVEKELLHQAFSVTNKGEPSKDEVNNKPRGKGGNQKKDKAHPNDDKANDLNNNDTENYRTEKENNYKQDRKQFFAERDAKKTCQNCNKLGHIWLGCPELHERFQH